MATTLELISIAVFTGIGSGIGIPIGNWFFKKFLEDKIDKAHNNIKEVGKKIGNGGIEIPKLDTEEQIKRMLGK